MCSLFGQRTGVGNMTQSDSGPNGNGKPKRVPGGTRGQVELKMKIVIGASEERGQYLPRPGDQAFSRVPPSFGEF